MQIETTKTKPQKEIWVRYTLLEAAFRTGTRSFLDIVGKVSTSSADAVFGTTVIGLVQTIIGVLKVKAAGETIFVSRKFMLGASSFGILAAIVTVLGFETYRLGGDLGVDTFILSLAIIPGALIDWVFFGHPLKKRQLPALLLACLAGYFILGRPNLAMLGRLPLWMYLSITGMFLVAINQGITVSVKDMNPFAKNAWAGIAQIIVTLVLFPFVYKNGFFAGVTFSKLVLVSALVGVVNVGILYTNQKAYVRGARIGIKKLVMNGTYLTLALVVGVLFFHDNFSGSKILGITFYLLAFAIWDDSAWEFVKTVFKKPVRT